MKFLQKGIAAWREDPLLRRVVKNSGYLFSGSTLGIFLSIATSVLSSRALGVHFFGILAAVTTFAALADKLLSFRIGELVVKYAGEALASKQTQKAAAVFKVATLTEVTVSFLSYAIIYALAPMAARYFAKDEGMAVWFMVYGLIVPFGLTFETSSALLQVAGKFKFQAAINLAQNIVTAGIVLVAVFSPDPFPVVILAYLAGKSVAGISYLAYGLYQAKQLFGLGWWKTPLTLLPPRKEFWGFAFSSNFSGTVNLLVRDSDVLWVNTFLNPTQGGLYKLAVSLIGFMLIPIDPFIKTSFPEITRTVTAKAWTKLRSLLSRLTLISGAVTLLFGGLFFIGGEWLIGALYGADFAPAWQPAMILFVGYGIANTFFWNRPLSLSLGDPYFPLAISTVIGAGKLVASTILLPVYGIGAQAVLMSLYFSITIFLILIRAIRTIGNMEKNTQADKIHL